MVVYCNVRKQTIGTKLGACTGILREPKPIPTVLPRPWKMTLRPKEMAHGTPLKAVLCLLGSALLWSQTTRDVENIQRAAGQGIASAQYILGSMYAQGRGVPQNYAEAARWYRQAAEQELAGAQSSLGALYAAGKGVPQDYSEALGWYRKAADKGDPVGQTLLGSMYDQGQGVPQDYAEAVRWYRKAADQGLAQAQRMLGLMYGQGQGIPQDYVQAHLWLNLAASRENGDAHSKDAALRDEIAAQMTSQQLAEAQRLAGEWKPPSK
jgi:uncharacterized protein